MSLTREEWEQMWACAKRLEHIAERLKTTNAIRAKNIMVEVKFMKIKIQQVIGQME